nr:MAG TPA: hypothetical protein [Caudoviricetes sp.]
MFRLDNHAPLKNWNHPRGLKTLKPPDLEHSHS